MYRPPRSIGRWFLLAAVAVVTAIGFAFDVVGRTCRSVAAYGRDLFDGLVLKVARALPEAGTGVKQASLRGFVVQRAHRIAREKRQAPRIENDWRMCPSI